MDQSTDVVVETSTRQFACRVAGEVDRPLALCLHGYPDTPRTWRYLADLGRADLAGPFVLGRDANDLHDALGGDERNVLIGHDWGAAAAYEASASAKERWAKVIAVSWPPWPAAIDLASFEQMRRSWYVFLFQTEAAVELVGDEGFLTALWNLWSPSYDATEDVKAAVAALNGPKGGALALQHYCVLLSGPSAEPSLPRHPTLYIHGENDSCIGSELVADALRHLPIGSQGAIIPGVGHFPQLEGATEFNDAVLAFLVDNDASIIA